MHACMHMCMSACMCVHSFNFDATESRLVLKERNQILRALVLFVIFSQIFSRGGRLNSLRG